MVWLDRPFNSFVQQEVLDAFDKKLGNYGLPLSWILGATMGTFLGSGLIFHLYPGEPSAGDLLSVVSHVPLGCCIFWMFDFL